MISAENLRKTLSKSDKVFDHFEEFLIKILSEDRKNPTK